MLVDVVSLRVDGQKRSKDEVLKSSPIRAELRVEALPGNVIAQLFFPTRAPAPGDNVPTLQDCRLRRVVGIDFILVGAEFVGAHHERHRVPQAWWCRLVPAGAETESIGNVLLRPDPR